MTDGSIYGPIGEQPQGSALQFGRKLSFTISNTNGEGLELSALRVYFRIGHMITDTPNSLYARIYNLSEQTTQQIRNEFTEVIVRAGYEGNFGTIFQGSTTIINKGNLNPIRSGRENPVDTFLDIYAADGDQAHNWGVVNQTLAAGWKPEQVVDAVGKVYSPYNVTMNSLPDSVQQNGAPRGKTCFINGRNLLRYIADTNSLDYGIHGGEVQWTPQSAYRPGDAVVLNTHTGLIGFPQQTENGVTVRCLLNPSIGIGTRIQIDNQAVLQAPLSFQYTSLNTQPSIGADGFYKVLYIDHIGDTRGNPWYSEMVCLATDPSAQGPLSVQGVAIPN